MGKILNFKFIQVNQIGKKYKEILSTSLLKILILFKSILYQYIVNTSISALGYSLRYKILLN